MPNIRAIKKRIQAVKGISQMTHAMELVATSRVSRVKGAVRSSRPYTDNLTAVVRSLAAMGEGAATHPLLLKRELKNILLLHISPDRGLTGGLDINVNQKTASFLKEQTVPVSLILLGAKGVEFFQRSKREVRLTFPRLGDRPKFEETLSFSKLIIDDYTAGTIDAVYLAYPHQASGGTQQPVIEKLLPIELEASGGAVPDSDYIFEPEPEKVLEMLLPKFVEIKVYRAILGAVMSEKSARMAVMRNATDNARDLITELTLQYNKERQESITNAILDLTRTTPASN